MQKTNKLLDQIASEVSSEDLERCRKELTKADRIGKFAVWACIIFCAFAGWFIVDGLMVDFPVHHPWYSKVPLVGEKLWSPPKSTQLPVVGQTIHDVGMVKFIGLCLGVVGGFILGKIISFLVRNGAQQDIKNTYKINI